MTKVKANFELEMEDTNYQKFLECIEKDGYVNIASLGIIIRKIGDD